jgi:hypothetical protein
VSLTGKLRFAYGEAKTAAGVKTTGIGVTDGDWNIAAVEDLGGGLKAGANMALRLRGRDNNLDSVSTGSGARPRDSSVYLTGNFGTVTAGAVESGNGLLPLLGAGGPNYIGLDAYSAATATPGVLSAANNTDLLSYRTPVMSGFSAVGMMLDGVGAGGAQSAAATQDAALIGLNYANGPLTAAVDFTNYGLNSLTAGADSRTRISANYDLGIARIGAGFQTAKLTTGIDRKETGLSVSAPFGAFNIGLIYASAKTDGISGNDKGYDFAVQYNLSKRTYVALQGQSVKLAGATASATNTRVQLAHSF